MPTNYDENSAVRMKDLQRGLVTAAMNSGGGSTTVSNIYFGECNTAGNVQAKTATINGFTPTNGARVCIKFSYQATVAVPTLNINNTGAYPIKYAGYVIPASAIQKNSYLDFVFFNGAYNFVGLLAADGDYLTIDPITYDECGNVWVKYGNPTLTTENAKFGTALYLDGNSSYLSSTDDFYLGGQDFTIDLWAYPTEGSSHNRIIDFQRSGGTYSDGFLLYALNNVFYLQGVMTSAVAISPRADGKDRGGATHRHQGNYRPSDSPGFEGEGQDPGGSHRGSQSGGGQMNPYEALANAIILQAKDYRASWK